jgi:hypothetical protein
MTPCSIRIAFIAILLSLTACSNPRAPEAVVRDSAGIRIVDNADGVWAPGEEWTIDAEPTIRIGSVDGADQATLFSYVPSVKRLSDGRIVILEGQAGEVRWFDAAGRHLFTRGGKGDGPGEFTAVTELLILPGDTVLVRNAPRTKFALFTSDGELIREEYVDLNRYRRLGQWMECLTGTLPDRSLLGCQREPGTPEPQEVPGHLRSYGRFAVAPPSLDTAYHLGVYGGIEQWGVDAGNGRTAYFVHPFHSITRLAIGGAPPRVAIALNPDYSIEIWTPTGRLETIVRRTNARRAATDEEHERAIELMRRYDREDPSFERALVEMDIPDSIPAIGSLQFGPDGEIWAVRMSVMLEDPRIWDVFNREGAYLGEVAAPANFIIHEIGTDYVLGLRRGDLDVPFVEVYRLTRGAGH